AAHMGVKPDSIDPAALSSELATGTIPAALAAAAATEQGTIAVDGERLTYAQLHERVTRAGRVLAHSGVGQGARVGISAPTSMRFVVAYLATLHVGATVVLANPAYTEHELDDLIARSGARLLIADSTHPAVDTVTLADVDAGKHETHPGAPVANTDVALLAYTSGTTGTPKGVPLTHGMVLASVRAAMRAWRGNADDTLVHTLPLFHQ